MSQGIILDTLFELLGGEFFTNDEVAGGAGWSPNNFKELYITEKSVAVRYHVTPSILKEAGLDFDYRDVVEEDDFDQEDIHELLETRNLGCLEGIYVSPALGGLGIAKYMAEVLGRSERNRIHSYGEAVKGSQEGTRVPYAKANEAELEGSEGWETRANLQPNHYALDETGGDLWSILQPATEAEDEAEGESEQSEDDDLRAEVEGYYSDAINGTVNKILREYNKIFSSGYEVIKPAGVLMENTRGKGVLGRIDGSALKLDRVERNLQFLYEELKQRMGLVEVPVRSTEEIANVVISGRTSDGERYSGQALHFPYKMMEYAFGQRFRATGEKDLTIYEGHDARKSWEDYSNIVVRASLRDVLTKLVWHTLSKAGIAEEYDGDEANQMAQDKLDKMQKALCTSILVSKFDITGDELVAIKIRVLDPDGRLPRDRNLLYDSLTASIGDLDGSDDVNVYPVESDGFFVEYQVELQKRLAGAEPLFAYKALQKILEQGKTLDYDSLIIGKDPNDRIIRNGGGQISFKSKLTHVVAAGSRAGKGVWTFAPAAGAIVGRKAIFYTDNKPDMASWFKKHSDNCFVINGHSLISGDGNDHFEQFINADGWVIQENIPDYVAPMLEAAPGQVSYKDLGAFVYTRALTLMMGIMGARVEVPNELNNLGGEAGVVFIVDELANATNGLLARLAKLNQKIANTAYYNELKAQEEAEERGEPVKKINSDKPGMDGYWFTQFYFSLKETIERMQSLSNAGLKNVEASRSDIFVLTQQPPEMVDSLSEVSDMFGKRNKNSMGIASRIDDPRILPSMVLVGGTDIFLGYDRDNGEFLAQRNPRSKAYHYLNEITRGFGYLPIYNSKISKTVGTLESAERACYYKPFLIFAEHSKNDYFAKNALKYAASVGIPEAHGIPGGAIIDRNINDAGDDFHEGVGLMGYLNMAGVSESEVSESLNQSGDIADYVVKAMGYPDQGRGTWMKFLMDMRPEWIFSAGDVIDALKYGNTLPDTVKTRMPEFTYIYPEAFMSLGGNEQGFDGDDLFAGESLFGSDANDTDEILDDEDNDEPEYEQQGGDVDGWAVDPQQGIDPTLGYQVFDDDFGTENVRHEYNPEVPVFPTYEGMPVVDPTNGESVFQGYQATGTVIPEEYEPGKFRYSDGQERTTSVDWTDNMAVQKVMDFLERAGLMQRVAPMNFGQGVYTDGNGARMTFDTAQPPVPMHMDAHPFDMREPMSVGAVVDQITQGALRLVGGPAEVRSIQVIGGALVMNKTLYKPKFTQAYLDNLPADFRNEVATGNVARLFNWGELNGLNELRRLSFDDAMFVVDYLTGPLGWRSKISVDRFFQRFSGLDQLTIENEKFTRQNYRSSMHDANVFYQPTRAWHISNTIDRAFSKGTSNTWNYTKSTLSRHDIGFGRKVFLGGAGIAGSALMGTATAASKTGRVAAKGIGHMVRSFGKAIRETNEM